MAELSTLARPYARAAFEFAVTANDLAKWSSELSVAAAVSQTEKVKKLLSSPSLTSDQQARHFIEVCGDALGDKAQNFIKVLAENKRLPLLPEIVTLFDGFKANREKSVDVEVATVFDLDEAIQQKLQESLAGKLEREVKLHTVIDKSLIGGVLIRAGDIVIDGSIKGRLAKLGEAMRA
jgi:F-type H+-transporting ATPase subunit delta